MIWRNFFRELSRTASRLVSAIIITALAVVVYTALAGVIYNGDRITEIYHREQNIADYWVTGTAFDRSDFRALERIEGVTGIQPRVVLDAEELDNEDIQLTLYGISGGYNINTPLLIEGAFPQSDREMMISSEFAKENGLRIGDVYEMETAVGGLEIKKTICGLIKSPECLYHVNASTLWPDFAKFGFAYMNEDAFADIWEEDTYNQFCVTVSDDAGDAEIKNKINAALGDSVINVLALEDNENAYFLAEQIDGLRAIVVVFPVIVFSVALLMMYSTMSRLIENARTSIGTMKALGYRDGTLLLYYLSYSVPVILVGFIIGVLPANSLLTVPVMRQLFAALDLPAYEMVPKYAAWGEVFILICVFCAGTAFLITVGALREKPVECMRPKPPKKVKLILPERIPFIWNKLSFSAKYIVRNIFRNKPKMLICATGVTGCMTLILSSFGIKNSVDNFTELMVANAHKYDAALSFDAAVTDAEYERIGKIDSVTATQYEMITSAKVFSSDKQETATFTVTDDVIKLKLPDIYGAGEVVLPSDGIIIGRDTAEKLGCRVGDTVAVKFTDSRTYYEMPVRGLSADSDGVFAGRSYWRGLSREFKPTSVYVSAADVRSLERRVDGYDFVSSFNTKKTVTDTVTNSLESLVTIVYILIVLGGALALVVLSNLGIMSFYEQLRNLATLAVLGFHNIESRKLLLTENVVFSLMGVAVGTPLGIILAENLIAASGSVNFELYINPLSYLFAAALTMLFTLLVNIVIGSKMKDIEMIGALKSIE